MADHAEDIRWMRSALVLALVVAPLAGLEMAGYRLVWKEEPNVLDKGRMESIRSLSLTYSLGMSIDKEGMVVNPRWDGPAFNAGLVTGTKIVAVGGVAPEVAGTAGSCRHGRDSLRDVRWRGVTREG